MSEPFELNGEGLLLRVFIGESDHWRGKPLYEAIMLLARERGLPAAPRPRPLLQRPPATIPPGRRSP